MLGILFSIIFGFYVNFVTVYDFSLISHSLQVCFIKFSPWLLSIPFFFVTNYQLHDGEDDNNVSGDDEFISEIESDIDENENVLLECAKWVFSNTRIVSEVKPRPNTSENKRIS